MQVHAVIALEARSALRRVSLCEREALEEVSNGVVLMRWQIVRRWKWIERRRIDDHVVAICQDLCMLRVTKAL